MRIILLLIIAMLAGCASADETLLDSDGDGYSDADEVAAGSDPNNATSLPETLVEAVNQTFTPVWGDLSSPIRPGAPIGWCTYNFLFFAPENGTYYIGTAAHCTNGPDQRMPLPGVGEIGTVVYDSDNATGGGPNADFSLVQLDEGLNLKANPTMMNLDGPTGYTEAGDVAIGDLLDHHGYGMVLGDNQYTRDRTGVFSGWSGGDHHDYCAESPIWWGDSGSPIIHQESQKAFGIVSRAGWFSCMPNAQLMGATMPYIFDEMAEHGWTGIELATI